MSPEPTGEDHIAAAKVFAKVRTMVVSAGGRALKLKELRHSCVVQLARSECTVPEICLLYTSPSPRDRG